MKNLLRSIFTLLCLSTVSMIHAQSSNLSVQGVLRRANGTAVENGQYDITFKLYTVATSGNPLWEESIESVDVEGGIYSVILGSGDTPLNAAFDQPYFLGVAIEGGTELIPRARLTSSPYALSLIGDDNVFPNSGNVGVGAANPQSKLTVARGDGTLGLEVEETAGNTAIITTTSNGMSFDAGGTDKDFNFEEGAVKVNSGDLVLDQGDLILDQGDMVVENGSFVFLDNASTPNNVASLGLDVLNGNELILSNTIGNAKIEGDKIILNSVDEPVEINKEGEALNLIGMDSTFITFSTPSSTGRLGFFNEDFPDNLTLETNGSDFTINNKGGVTKIINSLEVGSGTKKTYTHGWFRYLGRTTSGVGHHSSNYTEPAAIKADGHVIGVFFRCISDERVKKDFKISDAQADLNTLRGIEITDYRHIDEMKRGPGYTKGVIAQQLKTIFPEAVSLSSEHIPDIYALSSNITKNTEGLIITLDKPHDLKIEDNVKILTENGEEEVLVKSIVDEYSFLISSHNMVISDKVFVYGKEVDDFHTVDYDRVFTLAVSATQELDRKVEALEKENARLKKENERQLKANAILKAEVETVSFRLQNIESLLNVTSSN